MTEFDELKAEVSALRAEVEKWKAITIDVLGKASRAQGFAEGIGEGANMQIRFLTDRVSALEKHRFVPFVQPLSDPTITPVNPHNPLYPVYRTSTTTGDGGVS
jgi:hypothetical protein